MLGDLAQLDPGLIGGEGHVDDDGHVRALGEGAGPSAGQPGLLLGHGHGQRRRPGAPAVLRHQPRRLGGHEAADPVVDRTGHDQVVRELGGWPSITATSPIRTSWRASSASAAPMSMWSSLSSGTFLRSSSLSRWIGLRPITPATGPLRVWSDDPLGDQDLGIPSADAAEAQVAVRVDVGDVKPDLVDVPDDGQASVRQPYREPGRTTSPAASDTPTSWAKAAQPSRHTRAASDS